MRQAAAFHIFWCSQHWQAQCSLTSASLHGFVRIRTNEQNEPVPEQSGAKYGSEVVCFRATEQSLYSIMMLGYKANLQVHGII